MDTIEDRSLCISTLLHAWLYGLIPTLWTHDVWWPAGAFLSTFFAVSWPAIYREYEVFPDQIHLHSLVVMMFWTGAFTGLFSAWGLQTPSLIDTDPFFSSSKTHAEAQISKTTFYVLPVSLFITSEYFFFQYYDTFFSFGTSITIGVFLIVLYIIVNIGSYIISKDSHEYKQNSSYLSLLGIILFTHVIGDLLVYIIPDLKQWYGVMHFCFLVIIFYPVFFFFAWGKMCVHDKSKGAKRLLIATGIIHSLGYFTAWLAEIITNMKSVGTVSMAIFFYSVLVIIVSVCFRICKIKKIF